MGEQRQLHILLVEDDVNDAKLTRRWLMESELIDEVHVAPSGEQALEQLRAAGTRGNLPRIHLILMDLNLPRMSGLDTLVELRADPGLAGLPVIIMTSSLFPEDQEQAQKLQADLFLSKPCDADEFAELVRTIEVFLRREA
jgi:two-component system response regulator